MNSLYGLKQRMLEKLPAVFKSRRPNIVDPTGLVLPAPESRAYVGGVDDFLEVGNEFLGYFKSICNLKPDESLLDVGCGIGRMAIPLTTYMGGTARYEGFDIVKSGIYWCTENITPEHTNFQFHHSNILNKAYNPGGRLPAAEYRFPFEDGSFDFVFLTSVFTHMLPVDMEHYFREIARVLKEGGRCLITFFLLNPESLKLIESGKSTQAFTYGFGLYKAVQKNNPEAAIAYEEAYIHECHKKNGLNIQAVHYGSWCGRGEYLSYQDIIIAQKLG
jgi:ubiquinone/menaquinone biosynthesis C-methylase UbiE